MQYVIITIIIAIALGYAAWRIAAAFRSSADGCYGCRGCQNRLAQQKGTFSRNRKPDCYQKK